MLNKKLKISFKENLIWVILFACLVCFLALAEDVFTHDIMNCDIIGYGFVSKYLISNNLTPIVKAITWFGGATSLVSIAVVSFILVNDKKIGICIGANLVIIFVLNQALKFLLQRPRPTEYRIVNETGYSFPSGHSMISMAFYGYLIYLIYKYVNNKYLKWILICLLSLLILCIGISRIYLGVHYVSDVLAGFLISIAYLIIFTRITEKWGNKI